MRSLGLLTILLCGCFNLDALRAPDGSTAYDLASGDGIDLADPNDAAVPPGSDLTVPPDMASTRPPSTCNGLGGSVQLCDGFESAGFSQWGPVRVSGGDVTIDSNNAYRGSLSARFSVSGLAGGQAELDEGKTFGSLPHATHIRAFVYIPATTPQVWIRLFSVFASSGGYPGVHLYLEPQGTSKALLRIDDTSRSPAVYRTTSVGLVPPDQWVALEFVVEQTSTMGTLHTLVSGVQVSELEYSADWTPAPATPQFDLASVGIQLQEALAFSIDMDEIIIDTAAIGASK